jgi:hypothetical protein
LRFDKEFTHVVKYVKLECKSDLFRAESFQHDQFLKGSELLLPI